MAEYFTEERIGELNNRPQFTKIEKNNYCRFNSIVYT